jgi:hypothetical protein
MRSRGECHTSPIRRCSGSAPQPSASTA